MAIRTVRLDDEAERTLQDVRKATGLPISEVLKRGLRTLRERLNHEATQTPYQIYRELDLGPGGYARAASSDVKSAVRAAVRRKLRR